MRDMRDAVYKVITPVVPDFLIPPVGSRVEIHGVIYTARDAVMPRLVRMVRDGSIENLPIRLKGAAIMHTACSPAGFGPTSSNKEEIENAMPELSEAGVALHLGKGVLKKRTVTAISGYGAAFIAVPPVSALLQSRLASKKVMAFEDEGMEALHELNVQGLPGVVAAACGESIRKWRDFTPVNV